MEPTDLTDETACYCCQFCGLVIPWHKIYSHPYYCEERP